MPNIPPSLQDMQDDMRRREKSDLARVTLTQEKDGSKFTIQVSPCSWMNPNYGFQIQVQMVNGGVVHIHDRSLKFDRATKDDILRLFQQVKVKTCSCPGCTRVAFDPQSVDTNRAGRCEECFMQELNAELQKSMEKARQEIDALD